jgi:hypothetical protein
MPPFSAFKNKSKMQAQNTGHCASYLLPLEEEHFPEKSVNFYQSTRRQIAQILWLILLRK